MTGQDKKAHVVIFVTWTVRGSGGTAGELEIFLERHIADVFFWGHN